MAVFENESLAHLILQNLDNVNDIINFSETNKICNILSQNIRNDHKQLYIKNIQYHINNFLKQYIDTLLTCQEFGNFIYYIDDCEYILSNLTNFTEINKDIILEFIDPLFIDKLDSFKWELEEYKFDVYEQSYATYFDDDP